MAIGKKVVSLKRSEKIVAQKPNEFTLSDEAKEMYPFLKDIVTKINRDAEKRIDIETEIKCLCLYVHMECHTTWAHELRRKFGENPDNWTDRQRHSVRFVEALCDIYNIFESLFKLHENVQYMTEKLIDVQAAMKD